MCRAKRIVRRVPLLEWPGRAPRRGSPTPSTSNAAGLRSRADPTLDIEDHVTGIWYVVGYVFAGGPFVFLTIGLAWLISHRTPR